MVTVHKARLKASAHKSIHQAIKAASLRGGFKSADDGYLHRRMASSTCLRAQSSRENGIMGAAWRTESADVIASASDWASSAMNTVGQGNVISRRMLDTARPAAMASYIDSGTAMLVDVTHKAVIRA
jgi:hypothetical protein